MTAEYIEKVLKNHNLLFNRFNFNNKNTFYIYHYVNSKNYTIITGNDSGKYNLIDCNGIVTELTNFSFKMFLEY